MKIELIYWPILALATIILTSNGQQEEEEEGIRFIDVFYEYKKEILDGIKKLKDNLEVKEDFIPTNVELHKENYKKNELYKNVYDKLKEGFEEFEKDCLNPLNALIGENGTKFILEVEKFWQEIEEYIFGQIFTQKQKKLKIHLKLKELLLNSRKLMGKWRKCTNSGNGRKKMQEALYSIELKFRDVNDQVLAPIIRKFGAAISLGQSIIKFLQFIDKTNLEKLLIESKVKKRREQIDLEKIVEMFENYHSMIKAALKSLKRNKGLIFFKMVNPEEAYKISREKSAEIDQKGNYEKIIENNQEMAKLVDELLGHELLTAMEDDKEMIKLVEIQRKMVDLLQFIFFNRLAEPMKELMRDEFVEPPTIQDVVISLLECKFARLLLQKIILYKVPNFDSALDYLRQNLMEMKEHPKSNLKQQSNFLELLEYLNKFDVFETKIANLTGEMQSRENELIREFFGNEHKDPYKIWRFMFREGIKTVPNFPKTERELENLIEEVKKNKKELEMILEEEIDVNKLK